MEYSEPYLVNVFTKAKEINSRTSNLSFESGCKVANWTYGFVTVTALPVCLLGLMSLTITVYFLQGLRRASARQNLLLIFEISVSLCLVVEMAIFELGISVTLGWLDWNVVPEKMKFLTSEHISLFIEHFLLALRNNLMVLYSINRVLAIQSEGFEALNKSYILASFGIALTIAFSLSSHYISDLGHNELHELELSSVSFIMPNPRVPTFIYLIHVLLIESGALHGLVLLFNIRLIRRRQLQIKNTVKYLLYQTRVDGFFSFTLYKVIAIMEQTLQDTRIVVLRTLLYAVVCLMRASIATITFFILTYKYQPGLDASHWLCVIILLSSLDQLVRLLDILIVAVPTLGLHCLVYRQLFLLVRNAWVPFLPCLTTLVGRLKRARERMLYQIRQFESSLLMEQNIRMDELPDSVIVQASKLRQLAEEFSMD
ncbi:unnamed protein product [Protopolystoma xenopodis]|uniref:Uncharacterized protein n=1 Tax=Protopolystoma xenopodis TaxID=117903 RepID=A0A448XLK4_9PLAT|nr:unnamed protein product [Protopolystoma xenopodis]